MGDDRCTGVDCADIDADTRLERWRALRPWLVKIERDDRGALLWLEPGVAARAADIADHEAGIDPSLTFELVIDANGSQLAMRADDSDPQGVLRAHRLSQHAEGTSHGFAQRAEDGDPESAG